MDTNKKTLITLSVKIEKEYVDKIVDRIKRGSLVFGSTYNRSDVVRDALRKYFEGL